MQDIVVLAMLVLGFATFITSHFAVVVVLALRHRPRWRGLAVLAVPPLGPFWAWQVGRKALTFLWGGGLVLYLLGLLLSA